jgi:hypothetical protein
MLRGGAIRSRCIDNDARPRVFKTRPYVTSPAPARAHTGASPDVKESDLNHSDAVRPFHRAAPWLITAATILGLIVVFHH